MVTDITFREPVAAYIACRDRGAVGRRAGAAGAHWNEERGKE
jgi:hypothetical protein